MVVLTLPCHGCPLQAIVVAFGFYERTVARWQARAGHHCQHVHEHLVSQGGVELGHVQADELWIDIIGRTPIQRLVGSVAKKAIALWYAIAHNLLWAVSLRAALAAQV